MSSFKLETVKQQPSLPPPTTFTPLPKLNVNIQSIVCLNYPIQTLSQVLGAHFDEQPCAANLVVKALKVISISLKDKQLRTNVEKILSENLYKRQKIYTLLVYWSSFTTNLMPILSKLQLKLVQNVLGCAFSVYLFTDCAVNMQICTIISNALTQLSPESYVKVNQYIKNEFMSMDYPIKTFISNLSKFKTKSEKMMEFLNEIASSIIKSKQCQQNLRQYLNSYFKDSVQRVKIENFFKTFPNLTSSFINNLSSILDQSTIMQIWSTCRQYLMQAAIKSAIKEWVGKKQNYWKVFSANFNKFRTHQPHRLEGLLQLGYELDQDTIVPKFMIKQYLFNYFQGIDFAVNTEIQILQKISSNQESYKKMHSIGDTMSDMIKSFSNIQKDSSVSLVLMNKVHAPDTWPKSDFTTLKNSSYPLLTPFIEKLKTIFTKIQKENNEKGRKLQLAFHGIKITVTEEGSKRQLIVTLSQLYACLKSNKIPKESLLDEYHPIGGQVKKQQAKKEVQSIVIEAKIVRVMKKSKGKLTFNQIYQEVIKQINVPEQFCKMSLDKVISKGLVQVQSENYAYCP